MATCFGPYSRDDVVKIASNIPDICKNWDSYSSTLQEVYKNDIIAFYKVLFTYTCAWNNSDTELVGSLKNLLSVEFKDLILENLGLDISRNELYYDYKK